ncbi:MAG: hypothetical protein PHH68_03720 [Candidatus Omnitrophica bacterium]|jgi:hypothetical protein|nr:hypothetical protein [Candidatus Omnitrophota bacterium]MDD5079417.1 hypothetical protein [Candidatus Omnitrophota bacterium]
MADEAKQGKKECGCKKAAAMAFKVILGLAFLALGAYLTLKGRFYLLALIKGCVGLFFILVGVITLAIAKE